MNIPPPPMGEGEGGGGQDQDPLAPPSPSSPPAERLCRNQTLDGRGSRVPKL
jgi:hypothetical protein